MLSSSSCAILTEIQNLKEKIFFFKIKSVCGVCMNYHSGLLDGPKAINEDVDPGLNWDA